MTRVLGPELTLGEKPYVCDMEVDGLLHGAVVLAEHARATVNSIDTSVAESLPGVVRVLTAKDVPGTRYVGLIIKDWPVFVAPTEETRCVGDVVALVGNSLLRRRFFNLSACSYFSSAGCVRRLHIHAAIGKSAALVAAPRTRSPMR